MNKFAKAIRLSSTPDVPTANTLLLLVKEAEKRPNQQFETVWPVAGKPDGKEFYSLTCAINEGQADLLSRKRSLSGHSIQPTWTLCKTIGETTTNYWSHATGDLSLVLNLILSEVSGVQTSGNNDLEVSGTYKGLKESAQTFEGRNPRDEQSATLRLPSQQVPDSSEGQIMLAGDLEKVELNSLLQSITICKMTGRLNCYHQTTQAEIFFDQGALTHASMQCAFDEGNKLRLTPEQVVLDLLTWQTGTFRFNPGWTTSQRTIERRLESILLEGATLADYQKSLEDSGFTPDCILRKEEGYLNESVEESLRRGVPVDLKMQMEIYGKIGEHTPVSEITANLPSLHWMPCLFNLINCGFVSIVTRKSKGEVLLEPIFIDEDLAYNASRSIARPDTGIPAFPFFLLFLKQEFARCKRQKLPVSIVLFDVFSPTVHVGKADLDRLLECFYKQCEDYDLLAHYETLEQRQFAIILPHRKAPQAFMFIETLLQELTQAQSRSKDLTFRFGLASFPTDASSLETLVSAATHCKKQAIEEERPIVTLSGIESHPWQESRRKAEAAERQLSADQAADAWMMALTIAEEFNHDDPRLMLTVDRLTELYLLRKKFDMAEPLLKLGVDLKAGSKMDAETAIALQSLARCYFEQGKNSEAESALLNSIEVAEEFYGEKHKTVAQSYHNLATIYHLEDKFEPAKAAYQKALAIKRELFGRHDPDTLKIAQNYTKLLMKHERQSEAPSEAGQISGTWKVLDFNPTTTIGP